MTLPKRILAAVDFSAPSLAALEYAIRLYQRVGSHLTVVHVIEPRRTMRTSPRGPQPVVLMKDGGAGRLYAGEKLREVAEQLGIVASFNTRLMVCSGEPVDIICSAANELKASLILCGKTGRGGAVGVGKTARRLIAAAPCKVVPIWEDARGTLPHVTDCPA